MQHRRSVVFNSNLVRFVIHTLILFGKIMNPQFPIMGENSNLCSVYCMQWIVYNRHCISIWINPKRCWFAIKYRNKTFFSLLLPSLPPRYSFPFIISFSHLSPSLSAWHFNSFHCSDDWSISMILSLIDSSFFFFFVKIVKLYYDYILLYIIYLYILLYIIYILDFQKNLLDLSNSIIFFT